MNDKQSAFHLSFSKNNSNDPSTDSPKNCPNAGMYARFIDHDADREKEILVHLRCKSWSCPYCSKINSMVLRRKTEIATETYIDQIKQDGYQYEYYVKFLTLTVPGSSYRQKVSPENAETHLKKNWNKLRTAIAKKYGKFEYIWVVEKQRDGYPHLHVILLGKNIAPAGVYEYIKALWNNTYEMGFFWLNKVQGGPKTISAYLSKYISKGMADGRKHSKVYSMSKGIRALFKLPKKVITITELGFIRRIGEGKTQYEIFWSIPGCLEMLEDMPEKEKYDPGGHITAELNEQLCLFDRGWLEKE